MSKLAYHAGHFGSGSVGAIGRHNWQKRGEYDEHSNQDIDPTRSKDNILLQVPESGSLYQAAKERIETACTGRVTKASNWVTETIVYPPEDVVKRNDPQEIERYFQDVLAWHQLEFGFDNVLAAVVHMDETTPHMHTDIVPLTEDGRLSSKQVFARKELNRHHTELAAFLRGRGWDVQRGESTRNKQIRAKTVPAFKKAAEAEKTALVAEIEPLREKVIAINRVETTGFTMPFTGKIVVDEVDFSKIKEQAVGYIAKEESLQERSAQLDRREQEVELHFREREKDLNAQLSLLAGREVRTRADWANLEREQRKLRADQEKLRKVNAQLAKLVAVVEQREKAVHGLEGLPAKYEALENENKSLRATVETLTTEIKEVRTDLTGQIEGLKNALRAAYEHLEVIVKALTTLRIGKETMDVAGAALKYAVSNTLKGGFKDIAQSMADSVKKPDRSEVRKSLASFLPKLEPEKPAQILAHEPQKQKPKNRSGRDDR